MGRKPEIDSVVQATIERLAAEGTRPAEIRRRLAAHVPEAEMPSQRSVDRISRPYRARQAETAHEVWRPDDADPEDAGIALGALAAAITASGGRISELTPDVARWAIRVKRGVPDMPFMTVWRFAVEYASVDKRDHLDASLGWARALTGDMVHDRPLIEAHVGHHVARWIRRPLVVWARTRGAAEAYIAEAGAHGSLSSPGVESWFDSDYFGRLIMQTRRE